MWTFSSLSLQVSVMTFKQKVAHLAPDTDALWFFKCTGSDSPSLLLQEKPKQRRKTNTMEIHIMATDALADLVKSGGSSENKQWQESKGETSSWMKTWEMITDSPEWLFCPKILPLGSSLSRFSELLTGCSSPGWSTTHCTRPPCSLWLELRV